MLRKIYNYQKAIIITSLYGSFKDWRRNSLDYISLIILIFLSLIFTMLGFGFSTTHLSNSFWTLYPLLLMCSAVFDKDNFLEYLPVKKGFKVINIYIFILTCNVAYALFYSAMVTFMDVFFGIISGGIDYDYLFQMINEVVFGSSTVMIYASLILLTCFFRHIAIRIGLRFFLLSMIFGGWYFIYKTLPRDEYGDLKVNIDLQTSLYAFAIAALVFLICISISIFLQRRKKQFISLKNRNKRRFGFFIFLLSFELNE